MTCPPSAGRGSHEPWLSRLSEAVPLSLIHIYVDFEFCNQIRNGTLSADTVRQFYEQAEIDYEELAELIAELDMAGPMKALLTPYGEKAEALLRLLP